MTQNNFMHFFLGLMVMASNQIYAQTTNLCAAGLVPVRIHITPDTYPAETSWELRDAAGNMLAQGQANSDTVCVPDSSCYRFTIKDSYGDGICCTFGQGSYTVLWGNDTVAHGGQFTFKEVTYMGCTIGDNCQNALNINGVVGNYTAPKPETWYVFTPDTSGQYEITTCVPANMCDTKIYLYDYCTNLAHDTTNIATIYYNDNFCGTQSKITPILQKNKPYYLRIADKNNACGINPIQWQINYLGAVLGCTDPTACNYSPLATISSGTCIYPGDPNCPAAPDLIVNQNDLRTSVYLTTQNNTDQCMVNEGCINGYGQRTVVRFTTTIANIGSTDYFIGTPASQPTQFDWDPCHQHSHYKGYAEYVLFDANNIAIPVGFKSGFCVMDLGCPAGGSGKYGCDNMGISFNCEDIYDASLDCQWVDITDLDTGRYTLMIRVNWDMSPDAAGRHERNYNNNHAAVCVHIGMGTVGVGRSMQVLPNCPPVLDCMGVPFGRAKTDCNGVCNGTALQGDINLSGLVDSADVQDYTMYITDPNTPYAPCADLTNDQKITIADAAVLNNCINYGTQHNHPTGTHNHCTFKPMLTSATDSIVFSIENRQLAQGYFDVYVRNPNGKVAAVQFATSGVRVTGVSSLTTQPFTFMHSPTDSTIAGISYVDSSLHKSLVAQPLCRVYFSGITYAPICLQQIKEAITGNYERAKTGINTQNCYTISLKNNDLLHQNNPINIYPNPTNNQTTIEVTDQNATGTILKIVDVLGNVVMQKSSAQRGTQKYTIDASKLPAGVYLIQIKTNIGSYAKRLVVE